MRQEHILSGGRWKVQLIEEERPLPILFRQRAEAARAPSSETGLRSLLQALELLARRGTGGTAWAAPFRESPIAFLLDTMSDGVFLWSPSGELLFQNRAASELGLTRSFEAVLKEAPIERFASRGKQFECRGLHCGARGAEYFFEIIREILPPQPET
jgi:PAS domain-containing protein